MIAGWVRTQKNIFYFLKKKKVLVFGKTLIFLEVWNRLMLARVNTFLLFVMNFLIFEL